MVVCLLFPFFMLLHFANQLTYQVVTFGKFFIQVPAVVKERPVWDLIIYSIGTQSLIQNPWDQTTLGIWNFPII